MSIEWRKIKDAINYYVSNTGKISSQFGYLNPKVISSSGYLKARVTLTNGKRANKYVHRIVAENFCDNPEGCLYVHHKNGIKTDNRSNNLVWSNKYNKVNTHLENNKVIYMQCKYANRKFIKKYLVRNMLYKVYKQTLCYKIEEQIEQLLQND